MPANLNLNLSVSVRQQGGAAIKRSDCCDIGASNEWYCDLQSGEVC